MSSGVTGGLSQGEKNLA